MALPHVPPTRLPWRREPLVAAGLGWLLPGLGHLYVGRPVKAALFLVAILSTFLVGWHLTGYTIVDPGRYRLDFVAQILLGGPTLVALNLFGTVPELTHLPRFFEVGRLYVNVAGLLNFVATCDAVGETIVHNRDVLELRRQARTSRGEPVSPGEPASPVETEGDSGALPPEAEATLPWPGESS